MLVLSRKVGEKILIGDTISVTVVRVGQGGVRIGIEAPEDLEVVREELKTGKRKATDSPQDKASQSRLGAPK
ncbi:MAG: carbon storage regulator [Pirellulales bacterium]|jgi:carbon storage regulator|nr:carbon storage regulator [Pirellulales bacterium]HJN66011.1 carbon storage regulator [Pirellulales bacterium]